MQRILAISALVCLYIARKKILPYCWDWTTRLVYCLTTRNKTCCRRENIIGSIRILPFLVNKIISNLSVTAFINLRIPHSKCCLEGKCLHCFSWQCCQVLLALCCSELAIQRRLLLTWNGRKDYEIQNSKSCRQEEYIFHVS